MSKYVIKSCFGLCTSVYADGKEVEYECSNSTENEKCYEVENCSNRKLASCLLKVVEDSACKRCDGCGYDEGCADESCGTWAAYKCLDILNLEFIDE